MEESLDLQGYDIDPEVVKNAREHARKTHDKEQNFAKLQEIYANIAGRKE